MGLVDGARGDDAVGVKPGGGFAGVGEADADGSGGGGGHECGAEEALEVDGEVEMLLVKEAEKGEEREWIGAGAVEGDDGVDIGVAIDQGAEVVVDDPSDAGLGPEAAECGEGVEGVGDVAEGAWLDDGDAGRVEAEQGIGGS